MRFCQLGSRKSSSAYLMFLPLAQNGSFSASRARLAAAAHYATGLLRRHGKFVKNLEKLSAAIPSH
jgi:hypothetical protein